MKIATINVLECKYSFGEPNLLLTLENGIYSQKSYT